MLVLQLTPLPQITLAIENLVVIHGDGDPYTGDYEVTPSFTEQTLETDEKLMTADVTVHAIGVQVAANPQGGNTVTIGGNANA